MRRGSRRLVVLLSVVPMLAVPAVVAPVVTLPSSAPAPRPVPSHVSDLALSDDPTAGTQAPELQPNASGHRVLVTGAQATAGFALVGVTWDQPAGTAPVAVQVRTRGSAGWSEWQTLDPIDGGPDPGTTTGAAAAVATPPSGKQGRSGTEPLWVGDADGVQVAVSTTGPGADPADLHASLIDPGTSPADAVVGRTSGPANSAAAAPATPAIVTRAGWGADEDLMKWDPQYGPPIKVAFVHHTDTPNGYTRDEAPAYVRSIYTYHAVTLGWGDIGYNFLIDAYGTIYEGRSGGMTSTVIAGHTLGFNAGSVGVALLGTYSTTAPTAAQMDALVRLLAWRLDIAHVDPLATAQMVSAGGAGSRYPEPGMIAQFATISGHRDAYFTDCPGDRVYVQLPGVRDRVRGLMGTGFSEPTPGRPAGYSLDENGGLHPFGGAPVPVGGPWWPGADIARRVVAGPNGTGYVLDPYGGLHPFGTPTEAAPPVPTDAAYWWGRDVARDVVLLPGSTDAGYVLDDWGGVHPFGGAPAMQVTGYWAGLDVAVRIALVPGDGAPHGYVMDAWGGLHPIAAVGSPLPDIPAGTAYWPGESGVAKDLVLTGEGSGYTLDPLGGVHAFGDGPTTVNWYGGGGDPVIAGSMVDGVGASLHMSGQLDSVPGGTPSVLPNGSWPGRDVARDVAVYTH